MGRRAQSVKVWRCNLCNLIAVLVGNGGGTKSASKQMTMMMMMAVMKATFNKILV